MGAPENSFGRGSTAGPADARVKCGAMEEAHARDFVGYGAWPPDPRWPGGARLAVQIVMNYEEGSEYAIG